MNRLLSTVACDVRLQARNGFYWAVAFMLTVFAILVSLIHVRNWDYFLPPIVLGNLMIGTFMFVAGLVLLEKGEGTLEAQVVTPLRTWEYLGSKLLTLTGLAIAEHLFIVALAIRWDFDPLTLILGIVAAAAIYTLSGFLAVARYDSINEYIFPSMLWATFFSIPFLPYFDVWTGWLFYLHPLQAPLVLLKAAFGGIELWEWSYGIVYSAAWIGLLFVLSRKAFHRFITRKEGAR